MTSGTDVTGGFIFITSGSSSATTSENVVFNSANEVLLAFGKCIFRYGISYEWPTGSILISSGASRAVLQVLCNPEIYNVAGAGVNFCKTMQVQLVGMSKS